MKPKYFISKFSHKLILSLVFVIFSTNLISYIAFEIDDYNQNIANVEEERTLRANGKLPHYTISGVGGISRSNESKLIVSFCSFITFFLLLSRKRFFPFSASVVLLIPFNNFVFWLIGTQQLLFYVAEPDSVIGTDRILSRADFINFLSFFLILFLLLWLLLFSANNVYLNWQRKNALR